MWNHTLRRRESGLLKARTCEDFSRYKSLFSIAGLCFMFSFPWRFKLTTVAFNISFDHLNLGWKWASDLCSVAAYRPTLGPWLALTRPNSPLEIMCKFPYLALTRLNSHYVAQTRVLSPLPSGHQFQWARSVQQNFRLVWLGKVVHLKGGSVFSKLFQLDRTNPLIFVPKLPEILVEWIMPNTSSHSQGNFTINPQREDTQKGVFKNYK